MQSAVIKTKDTPKLHTQLVENVRLAFLPVPWTGLSRRLFRSNNFPGEENLCSSGMISGEGL
jgi:hypothetical protein